MAASALFASLRIRRKTLSMNEASLVALGPAISTLASLCILLKTFSGAPYQVSVQQRPLVVNRRRLARVEVPKTADRDVGLLLQIGDRWSRLGLISSFQVDGGHSASRTPAHLCRSGWSNRRSLHSCGRVDVHEQELEVSNATSILKSTHRRHVV
jgi:hypothetical protein